MENDLVGYLVYSRKGRDQGKPFLVVGQVNQRYVLVADGDLRRMENPKLKNLRHLKITDIRWEEMVPALARGEPVENHRIRKVVRELATRYEEVREGGSE